MSMNKPSYNALIVLFACVVATWAASGFLLYSDEERGTFGDMFGAVNALFSGLAFAGIVYTILLQRRELELQREELHVTRLELSRSAAAQEKAEAALAKQVEALQYGQRLTTINNLLEFANHCNDRLKSQRMNAVESHQQQLWASRRYQLMERLDEVFRDAIKPELK